ncbi:hypothetical protein P154DRAFT_518430 [Amniculicola lignicola CBS 123094]|uniref:Uncharacterized protein n=1 Tax=Amniculicola lignicola CBS 123094 TaxID=1392246 RepID=A0A6A5WVR9_9PLEO|nr:hypothetical protein P154DRAFT_518430 [Amniculicola lignicola CBS 123094]
MFAARLLAKRAPITKVSTAFARFNSTSSAGSRVAQLAAHAEKPSALEAAVPVMWLLSGAAIYTAWNRVDEKTGNEAVDKLLIV